MDVRSFRISEAYDAWRLDQAVPFLCGDLSRSALRARDVACFVNGKRTKLSLRLHAGDCLEIQMPPVQMVSLQAEAIDLDIVYEDADILVLNKPCGMVVHPSAGHASGSLVHAILHHYQGEALPVINGTARPGIVHRLDKDTSGLLVVARTDLAMRNLSQAFKERQVQKIYHAVVHGQSPTEGEIRGEIGRSLSDRKKMAIRAGGRAAHTQYWRLSSTVKASHLKIQIYTGRTHQIRVHLHSIGHPIFGDAIYGKHAAKVASPQVALQLVAKELAFLHPRTRVPMHFEIALPAHMDALLKVQGLI